MKNILKFITYKIAGMAMLFTCIITNQQVNAQNMSATDVMQAMQSIYKNYDSIAFLSFDVKFNYTSDTLLGEYNNEQLEGSYTMAGKKAKYRLGDIDFMQNESFFIAVYNKDKLILVDEPKTNNTGNQLPMRQMMDSLVQSYTSHYFITGSSNGVDTNIISFDRADSAAQFDKFTITYDNRSNMLCQMAYEYSEPPQLDSTLNYVMAPPDRKRRLTIQYSNYRFDNYEDSVYDENNYIYFERGVCKPVPKYDNYKVYNSKPPSDLSQDSD